MRKAMKKPETPPAGPTSGAELKSEAAAAPNVEQAFDMDSILKEATEAVSIANSVPIPRGRKGKPSPAEEASRDIKLARGKLGAVFLGLNALPADTVLEVREKARQTAEDSARALMGEIRTARDLIRSMPAAELQPPPESPEANATTASASATSPSTVKNNSKIKGLDKQPIFAPRRDPAAAENQQRQKEQRARAAAADALRAEQEAEAARAAEAQARAAVAERERAEQEAAAVRIAEAEAARAANEKLLNGVNQALQIAKKADTRITSIEELPPSADTVSPEQLARRMPEPEAEPDRVRIVSVEPPETSAQNPQWRSEPSVRTGGDLSSMAGSVEQLTLRGAIEDATERMRASHPDGQVPFSTLNEAVTPVVPRVEFENETKGERKGVLRRLLSRFGKGNPRPEIPKHMVASVAGAGETVYSSEETGPGAASGERPPSGLLTASPEDRLLPHESQESSKFKKCSEYLKARGQRYAEGGLKLGGKVGKEILSCINQFGEFYDKQPLWAKLGLTGALVAGTAISAVISAPLATVFTYALGVQRFSAGLAMYTKFRKFGLDAEQVYKDEKRWNITRNAALMFAGTGEAEKTVLAASLAGLYGGLGVELALEVSSALRSEAVTNWLKEMWPGSGQSSQVSSAVDAIDWPAQTTPQSDQFYTAAPEIPVKPEPITPQTDQFFYTAPESPGTPEPSTPITPQTDQFYTAPESAAVPEKGPVAPSLATAAEIPVEAPKISTGITLKGFEWTMKNGVLEQLKAAYPDANALLQARPDLEGSHMHRLLLAESSPQKLGSLVREFSSSMRTPSGQLIFDAKLDKSAILKAGTTISFDENGMLKIEYPTKGIPSLTTTPPAPEGLGSAQLEANVDARLSQTAPIQGPQSPLSATEMTERAQTVALNQQEAVSAQGTTVAAPFDTAGFKPEYLQTPEGTPAELKPPSAETPPRDQGILRREAQNESTEAWKEPDTNASPANPYADDIKSFQQTTEGPSSPTQAPESLNSKAAEQAAQLGIQRYEVNSSGVPVDLDHAREYFGENDVRIVFGGTTEERTALARKWLEEDPKAPVYFESTKTGLFGLSTKIELTRAFVDPATKTIQMLNGSMDASLNPALNKDLRVPATEDLKRIKLSSQS